MLNHNDGKTIMERTKSGLKLIHQSEQIEMQNILSVELYQTDLKRIFHSDTTLLLVVVTISCLKLVKLGSSLFSCHLDLWKFICSMKQFYTKFLFKIMNK